LAKTDRLHRRQDFLKAQAVGRRYYTPSFGICLAPNTTGSPRLGLVVGKRLGKAVRRNRVKRLLREFFRRHKGMLPSVDLIVMAKKGAAELSYPQVEEELSQVLVKDKNRKPPSR